MATLAINMQPTQWRRITNPGDVGTCWKKGRGNIFVCQTDQEDDFILDLDNGNVSLTGAKRVPLDEDSPDVLALFPLSDDHSFYALSMIYGSSMVVDAESQAILPLFQAKLKTSIVPDLGNTSPLFVRSSTATVTDFELAEHTAKINEARFPGTRRVENLIPNSEDASQATNINTGVTVSALGGGVDDVFLNGQTGYAVRWQSLSSINVSGRKFISSVCVKGSGDDIGKDIFFKVQRGYGAFSGTQITATLTGDFQKIEVGNLMTEVDNVAVLSVLSSATPNGATNVIIKEWMTEESKGTQTSASEYVSNGVLSYPYHGTGADGVRYFDTDRSGNKIPDSTIERYLCEKESTNILTYSEQFDNAVWSKVSGATITPNQVLSPKGELTADLIDISVAGAYISYNVTTEVTLGEENTYSIWLRSISGEGTYPLNWYDDVVLHNRFLVDITEEWQRFDVTFTPDATAAVVLVYLGDSRLGTQTVETCYGWHAQLEQSPFPTSEIKTESTTATRLPDELSYDNSDNKILPNSFSMTMSAKPAADGADYGSTDFRLFTGQGSSIVTTNKSSSYNYTPATGGGFVSLIESDITKDIRNKYGFQLYQDGTESNAKIFLNGTKKIDESNTQTLLHSDEALEVGSRVSQNQHFTGNVGDINIYAEKLNDTQMDQRTEA